MKTPSDTSFCPPNVGSTPTRKRPVAVFDLDGTLVDTAPDLAASLNHCLAHAGMAPVPVEIVRPHAGFGVRIMLEHAYRREGRVLGSAEMTDQFARFLIYYEGHIADHSRLFPGALDALDRLERGGFALAICTNKLEAFARLLMVALGLDHRFAAICGADTFAGRKPDPAHLRGTIAQAGGDRRTSVMIGDTHVDVDAAAACGIPSILMMFGYGADEAARAGASRCAASFDEVDADLLTELIERRSLAG